MPTPRKPKPKADTYRVNNVNLNGCAKELCELAGVKENSTAAKQLMADVGENLIFYQVFKEEIENAPTPGQVIEGLQDILIRTRKLRKSYPDKITDILLEQIVQSLVRRIDELLPLSKKGRPRQQAALKNTCTLLFMTFVKYSPKDGNYEGSIATAGKFIAAALDHAGIRYPGRESHQERFRALFEPIKE